MAKLTSSICVLLALVVSPALSYFALQAKIPNGNRVQHPCKVNFQWPGVGHQSPLGKNELNIFGVHFKENGLEWTTALCNMDSDGDGMTNGQELGDPDCIWKEGDTPSRVLDITHPGICNPYNSPQCLGNDTFVDCAVDNFEKCEKIENPGVSSIELNYTRTDVPPVSTSYYCMTFDLSTMIDISQDYHVIADQGLIDNRDVMHHMLLYGCLDEGSATMPEPEECGMAARGCNDIIGLWAVGAPGNCYKADAGFRIGRTGFKKVMLQFHWNNPRLSAGYTDASGMRLYIQPARPEIQDLATLWVGQRVLEIPPGESSHVQSGSCPGKCTMQRMTKNAYIIQVINHAHYLGRSIKVEQFRDGKLINVLSNDPLYFYDSPVLHYHDPPIELRPGDDVKITCAYNSLSADRWVYYGDGTDDEMCIGFIMAYPADAFRATYCSAHGVLSDCEMRSGTPVNTSAGVCDWSGDVVSSSSPAAIALRDELARSCNIYGFCRPECRRVVDRLRKHPCFQGRMGETLVNLLERIENAGQGVPLLARINSCPDERACADQCTDECHDDDDDGVYGGVTGSGPAAMLVVVMTALSVMFL